MQQTMSYFQKSFLAIAVKGPALHAAEQAFQRTERGWQGAGSSTALTGREQANHWMKALPELH